MFDRPPTCAHAVEAMSRWGLMCVPSYFGPRAIARLGRDFAAIQTDQTRVLDHVSCGNGRQTRAHRRTLIRAQARYAGLSRLLLDPWLGDVVRAYLDQFGCFALRDDDVHEQLEIEHNERPGASCNSDWHFDRVPSIKVSVYLHTTGADEGALEVVPGSHLPLRLVAVEALRADPNPLNLDNFIRDRPSFPCASLHGGAGTVVVLDTLVAHRGGRLAPGCQRRNVRLTTFARPLTSAYYQPPRKYEAPGLTPAQFETFGSPHNRKGQPFPERFQFREHPLAPDEVAPCSSTAA